MIKELRQQRGLTQSQLGGLLKLPYQSVQKWEKGKNKPTTEQLPQLAHILGVSIEHLISALNTKEVQAQEITEQGMWQFTKNNSTKSHPSPTSNARVLPPSQSVELPHVSALGRATFMKQFDPAAASFGLSETTPAPNPTGEDLSGQLSIEITNDDSMAPNYHPGTKVRVKHVDRSEWPYLLNGVYAVAFANQFVVRRIHENDLEKGHLTLHADNKAVAGPITIPVEQIHHIFRVLRIFDAPAV